MSACVVCGGRGRTERERRGAGARAAAAGKQRAGVGAREAAPAGGGALGAAAATRASWRERPGPALIAASSLPRPLFLYWRRPPAPPPGTPAARFTPRAEQGRGAAAEGRGARPSWTREEGGREEGGGGAVKACEKSKTMRAGVPQGRESGARSRGTPQQVSKSHHGGHSCCSRRRATRKTRETKGLSGKLSGVTAAQLGTRGVPRRLEV